LQLEGICKKKCAATEAIETNLLELGNFRFGRKKKCAATEAIETAGYGTRTNLCK
jgi:hypothetical protein